jgi:hypothetical protein
MRSARATDHPRPRVVTRRNGNGKGHRDQDLALVLLWIEAAFGPVEVLEVRPNPRPARHDAGGTRLGRRRPRPASTWTATSRRG